MKTEQADEIAATLLTKVLASGQERKRNMGYDLEQLEQLKGKILPLVISGLVVIISVVLLLGIGVAIKEIFCSGRLLLSTSIMTPTLAAVIGPLLAPISVSSGVLIAILTFARDREKHAREREENRSQILFEQAKDGLNEVLDLLEDQNNDRVTWIRAARVLIEAQSLGKMIKSPEYEKAYKLFEDKIRSELYKVLAIYDEKTKKWSCLPPQFFYGIPNWREPITLDQAAIAASSKIKVYQITIDSVTPGSGIKPLSYKSVVAVFDFLEFPNTYADPLDAVKVWTENWESVRGPSEGARRYIAHARSTLVVNGKIINKS